MRRIKIACIVLICLLTAGIIGIPANATETENITSNSFSANTYNLRATGLLNMTIPAKVEALANIDFPLAAGETVTIKASYSPFNANVDFGLVDSEGVFYYVNVTNGSIDKAISVNESGDYKLKVRNNSSSSIEVSGFVNY